MDTPLAWEIHFAWKYAVLDAETLLAILKENTERTRRWVIGNPNTALEAQQADLALREIERVAHHLRWLLAGDQNSIPDANP